MRGKKFRLSTHVRLLSLTLESKVGLTNYLKKKRIVFKTVYAQNKRQ